MELPENYRNNKLLETLAAQDLRSPLSKSDLIKLMSRYNFSEISHTLKTAVCYLIEVGNTSYTMLGRDKLSPLTLTEKVNVWQVEVPSNFRKWDDLRRSSKIKLYKLEFEKDSTGTNYCEVSRSAAIQVS